MHSFCLTHTGRRQPVALYLRPEYVPRIHYTVPRALSTKHGQQGFGKLSIYSDPSQNRVEKFSPWNFTTKIIPWYSQDINYKSHLYDILVSYYIRDDQIMVMGARRAGYFASLIIMILGIIQVPLGLIFMAGGLFESMMDGDADTFMTGLAMVIFGTLMFIVGLIASVVLKKSDAGNVTISINAKDSMIQGIPEPNPILKLDKSNELESMQPQIDDQNPDEKAIEEKLPQMEPEEISLKDMVMDLQEAKIGDSTRLDYIAKRIRDNRTIYNSDSEYVKKKFTEMRENITKDQDT